MQTNTRTRTTPARPTHESGRGMVETPIMSFERVLNACMLWEDTFYLNGEDVAVQLSKSLQAAMASTPHAEVRRVILAARGEHNIRHASLHAAVQYAKLHGEESRQLIEAIIQRADELAEVLAMAGGRKGMTHAIRKGLNGAFAKFDPYQLAKYRDDKEKRAFTMKDVIFLTHPSREANPAIEGIVSDDPEKKLAPARTWESELSGDGATAKTPAEKRAVFEGLLRDNKMGAMALLRNLRNFRETEVDVALVAEAFRQANWRRVLPFRFLTAALMEPSFADVLEDGFARAVAESARLPGSTAVLVDTSASMGNKMSARSIMSNAQVGAAMAAAINGDKVDLYQWADRTEQVYKARGLGAAIAISGQLGRVGHGTQVGQALDFANSKGKYDRIVVVTDMQFADGMTAKPSRGFGIFGGGYGTLPTPKLKPGQRGYTLNLASYDNPGLMIGDWTHLSGFSTAILKYMSVLENEGAA